MVLVGILLISLGREDQKDRTAHRRGQQLFEKLTPEELERVEGLTDEEIREALEEGRRERQAARLFRASGPALPRIPFR